MNNNFINLFKEIRDNIGRQNDFSSNAIDQDKRLFKILNANIKTYNTYYKYLDDLVNKPEEDNHQKKKVLEKIGLYTTDESNVSINSRMSIALKVYDNFEQNSFIRNFMIFLFAINSSLDIDKSAAFLSDTLPEELLSKYNDYLRDAYKETNIMNPIFGFYVFYSDKEFLYSYIDYFINMTPDQKLRLEAISHDRNNFINSRRIRDLQKGSLLNEALIGGLYLKLCEIDLNGVEGYSNIIHIIIESYKEMINYLEIENKPSDEEWEKLEKLLNELSENEKKEILISLGNISENIENYEPDDIKKSIKMVMNVKGFDIERTSKQRVGQAIFRKNLIAQFENCKCRVDHCKIEKVEFLRASHILEWSKSDEYQKTDPNNGLLLCPMHDFLFDAHLITFNNDGKIIISKSIPEEYYDEFNISLDSKINVLPDNIVYLEEHRKIFKEREEQL